MGCGFSFGGDVDFKPVFIEQLRFQNMLSASGRLSIRWMFLFGRCFHDLAFDTGSALSIDGEIMQHAPFASSSVFVFRYHAIKKRFLLFSTAPCGFDEAPR